MSELDNELEKLVDKIAAKISEDDKGDCVKAEEVKAEEVKPVEVVHEVVKARGRKTMQEQPKKECQCKARRSSSDWYVEDVEVEIEKMFDDVILPQYAHEGDACADVRAYRIEKIFNENGVEVMSGCDFESIKLYQGWTAIFGTGFKIKLPKGWAVNIQGRSGFSIKECATVPNAPAKIDCPYTGEYRLALVKLNKKSVTVHKNDRIAQMEIVPQYRMIFKEVDKVYADEDNQRKETGLGDSGLK